MKSKEQIEDEIDQHKKEIERITTKYDPYAGMDENREIQVQKHHKWIEILSRVLLD